MNAVSLALGSLLVTMLMLAGLVNAVSESVGSSLADTTQDSIPACVSEDGSGGSLPCYWDADAHGNGKGTDVLYDVNGTAWPSN